MKIHIVQKGDTLWKIAKKYGVNFEELKKMNSQLSNPDMIMPGMKVKIPTTGGNIKKEAPLGMKPSGVQKEMPIAKEQPIAMPIKEAPVKEVPIKEVPIKEVPIKEAPIAKEVPNAPYTPKMPLQIIPEIDINNYYTMNMQNMTVETPPPPPPKANIVPEVKEVPKKEVPIKEVPLKEMPVMEAPIQAPPPPPPAPVPVQVECQDYCVPVTPVMPGSGFCPPFDPVIPYQPIQSLPYPAGTGFMPPSPGFMPPSTGYPAAPPAVGVNPAVAGTSFVPPYYDDESSSFMPQMPVANPGYQAGSAMGGPNPYMQQPAPFMDHMAQYPAGYPASGYPGTVPAEYPGVYQQGMPSAYAGEYPGGYPAGVPRGYPGGAAGAYSAGAPAGYPEGTPGAYSAGVPAGYPGGTPGAYSGGVPTGYPGGAAGAYPGSVPTGYPAGVPSGYSGGVPSGYQAELPSWHEGAPSGFQTGYQGSFPAAQHVPEAGYMNPSMMPQYGHYPYGYPQMAGTSAGGMGAPGFEMSGYPSGSSMPFRQEPVPQSFPVGTGASGDCGCDDPQAQQQMPGQSPEHAFIPPTPPIYSAPFISPVNTLQPPLMNPYGMESIGMHPYGMPRYQEESNENEN